MLYLSAVYSKIIEEYFHECWDVVVENFVDNMLECGGCCVQPKHHDRHKNLSFYYECLLLLVIRVHPYLIALEKECLH